MENLPMPSDLRPAAATVGPPSQSNLTEPTAAEAETLIEPPSVKLIARLFVIPFLIVGAAVGVMFLISLMAGRQPTMEEAIARLKNPGGGRTAEVLVGPGSKQRYLDAKALTDLMKAGMAPEQRVRITGELVEILDRHTKPGEGEVQHFLLLALGRAWQIDPAKRDAESHSGEVPAARAKAADALIRYAGAPEIPTRKAALLAMVYLKGHDPEVARMIPVLNERVRDSREDLDVRLSAATALGPLAKPGDTDSIEALHRAMRDDDPHNVELVWQSALSLAQLKQPDVADTILMLLDREELSRKQVYDREADPKNPVFRKLSEQEQERILINTIIGVEDFDVPAVRERLNQIGKSDPSPRVRAALRANAPRDAAR